MSTPKIDLSSFSISEDKRLEIIIRSLLSLTKGKYNKEENVKSIIHIFKKFYYILNQPYNMYQKILYDTDNNVFVPISENKKPGMIITKDEGLISIISKIKTFMSELNTIIKDKTDSTLKINKLLLKFTLNKNKELYQSITKIDLPFLNPEELLKTGLNIQKYAEVYKIVTECGNEEISGGLVFSVNNEDNAILMAKLSLSEELKLSIPETIPKTCIVEELPLAKINPHPRDKEIFFDEIPHIYYVKGKPVSISVTGFIDSFFAPFNADEAINQMITSKKFPFKGKHKIYKELPIWMTNNQKWEPNAIINSSKETYDIIKNLWEENKIQASKEGTRMHADCEKYLNGLSVSNTSKEFGFFINYVNMMTYYGWVPYRTEQKIWAENLDLAGCVDMMWCRPEDKGCKPRKIFLVDWKRAKNIELENSFQKGLGLLGGFDDCNYVHYQLQLNIYKKLLEQYYDVEIVGMEIVVFHPDNENELRYTVPVLDDLVTAIFNERQNLVKNGLHKHKQLHT
jgi:hypothetical protein